MSAQSVFSLYHALCAGFTSEEAFNLTKIDRWFLTLRVETTHLGTSRRRRHLSETSSSVD